MNRASSWASSLFGSSSSFSLRALLWTVFGLLRPTARLAVTTMAMVALLAASSGCCGSKNKGSSPSFRTPSAADGKSGDAASGGGDEATAAPGASASGGAAVAAQGGVAPARGPRGTIDLNLPGNADRRSRLAQNIARASVDPNGPAFASPALLTSHFQKHGEAMGYTSEMAYLAGAQHLIKNPEAAKMPRGRDTLYFLSSTGEFAVLSGRGALRTYFVPSDPDGYWARQRDGDADRKEEEGERRRLRHPR